MTYIDTFLNLKCAGDILNIIPKQEKYSKEISESMGIIKRMKGFVLDNKTEYTLLDLCAGNALTSVLSVFTLPIKNAIAIDKKIRKGNYEKVNRFDYFENDIFSNSFSYYLDYISKIEKYILISVHACRELAIRIIDIFNQYENIKRLYLMPCCVGNMNEVDPFLINQLGKYKAWCYMLKNRVKGKTKIYQDNKILSPVSIIIEGWKD